MKKYELVGSYSETGATITENDIVCKITIPLQDNNGNLKFGMGNLLSQFEKNGIVPTEDGVDLLCLAMLVYLADTQISREKHSEDSWTREISITLPVFDLSGWSASKTIIKRMLNFLTGDLWEIKFTKRDSEFAPQPNNLIIPTDFDAVTLFSGGMDSLIATINLLEKGNKIALISHAADSYTKNSQKKLTTHFQKQYPQNTPVYFDLWTSFEPKLVKFGGSENSTRSRSFLFISFGICALSGIPGVNVLNVPENALIALNIPLDSLRIGSHSTRTTHPFYLGCWNTLLSEMNMGISVVNPYWNKTKGEMAKECVNKDFLYRIIADSISCSSPQKLRYRGVPPQHCGYCVPCIIRRAAMAKAFGIGNDPTKYFFEQVSELCSNHSLSEGVQLRSFEVAISRIVSTPQIAKYLVHKSGPLDGDDTYIEAIANAYSRGLHEVGDFVRQSIQAEANSSRE